MDKPCRHKQELHKVALAADVATDPNRWVPGCSCRPRVPVPQHVGINMIHMVVRIISIRRLSSMLTLDMHTWRLLFSSLGCLFGCLPKEARGKSIKAP